MCVSYSSCVRVCVHLPCSWCTRALDLTIHPLGTWDLVCKRAACPHAASHSKPPSVPVLYAFLRPLFGGQWHIIMQMAGGNMCLISVIMMLSVLIYASYTCCVACSRANCYPLEKPETIYALFQRQMHEVEYVWEGPKCTSSQRPSFIQGPNLPKA